MPFYETPLGVLGQEKNRSNLRDRDHVNVSFGSISDTFIS